jgi:hypothetical protein
MAGEALLGAAATGLGDALSKALGSGAPLAAEATVTPLTDEVKTDMTKDIIALIFSASSIPPRQIIARFNAVRPLFDDPEYVKWLGY